MFIELCNQVFCRLSQWMRYGRMMVEMVVFERGVGHFEHKFQGEVLSSTNDFWRLGISHGVVCVILRLAVLIQ